MDAATLGACATIGMPIGSVLCFIAYKHPDAYRKMFPVLMLAISAVLIGIFVWDSALFCVSDSAFQCGHEKACTAYTATEACRVGGPPMIILAVSLFFVLLLSTLPGWLIKPPDNR